MARVVRKQSKRVGAAAVEFAVVLTLLVPVLLGTWEVGRLVEVQQLMATAAREGGRQAATGTQTTAQVQAYVVNLLAQNGITCTASNVTYANITDPSNTDPSAAAQMDQIRVTVSIPFDNVRWILLNQITNAKTLNASADWRSMRDLPLTVNTTIPLN